MKPIENPLGCLFRRSIDEIAQTVRSISQHPDPRSPRPTVVFKCGFHESYGIAHRVLCDPSKTAAQPAFTRDAACDNVVCVTRTKRVAAIEASAFLIALQEIRTRTLHLAAGNEWNSVADACAVIDASG